jgi:hypothetical protein
MLSSKPARLSERIQQAREHVLSRNSLLLLLLLPLVVILLRLTIWRVPVLLTHLLALDALLLMLFISGRILVSYGESRLPVVPARLTPTASTWQSCATGREAALQAAAGQGYRCDNEAGAGVKLSAAPTIAASLLILGLFCVIPVGVYDYLRNFSGIAYLGTGKPLPLDAEDSYGIYARGPLASYAEIGMKIRGEEIIPPSRHYPLGGKAVVLLANDGTELWRGVFVPGMRHRQGSYDFYMEGFVFDLFVAIGTRDGHGLFGSRVRVTPLATPADGYTHYSTFEAPLDKVKGEIWFNMETDRTRIRLTHGGKITEALLGTAADSTQTVDGYNFNLAGIGRWAHVNILRVRHVPLMKVGGILLLLGLVSKLLLPVRRFMLATNPDGSCRLLTNDGKLLQLVKNRGERR